LSYIKKGPPNHFTDLGELNLEKEFNNLLFCSYALNHVEEFSKKTIDGIKNKTKYENILLDEPIKNYIFLRLHSIFEIRFKEVLSTFIDDIPHEKLHIILGKEFTIKTDDMKYLGKFTQGLVASLTMDSTSKSFENNISSILNTKKYSHREKVKEFKFFTFFSKVIVFSDELKKFLDEKYQNNWFNFLENYRIKRNESTHNLSVYTESNDEIRIILHLYKSLILLLPELLKLMITYFETQKKISENEFNDRFVNYRPFCSPNYRIFYYQLENFTFNSKSTRL